MRILYLITGLGVGGAERLVVDLADSMANRGHDVVIFYLIEPVRLRPTCERVRLVGAGVARSLWDFPRAFLRAYSVIRDFRPNVVHSHMVHPNLLARLLRPFSKMPRLVCTAHNTYEGGRARMLAYRLTHFLADLTTNVTHEAVAAFEKAGAVPAGRMAVVHNGIDTRRFCGDESRREGVRAELGVSADVTVFICVARFEAAKDHRNLLEAFRRAHYRLRNVRLWLVGDGPLMEPTRNAVSELGLGSLVQFLGVRFDVPDLLSAADIFVLSSAWEGFGLVVAEAMACRRIVVATDSGGVKEVVGDCGYIVPPKNSIALAQAMVCAAEMDRSERYRMRDAARERVVARYSIEAASRTWEAIYNGASG